MSSVLCPLSFLQHIPALTRPPDEIRPIDILEVLQQLPVNLRIQHEGHDSVVQARHIRDERIKVIADEQKHE